MEFPEYPYSKQQEAASSFMYKVYGWMSFALAITAAIAFYISQNPVMYSYVRRSPWLLIVLIIVQFAIVIGISASIMRMTYSTAVLLFMLYAASVGVTMSLIIGSYTPASVYTVFLVTSLTFVSMSLYGYFTKADLTSWGSFGFMALIGIIIASVVNIFLRNPMFNLIISYIGVFVFILLTAYDTQKLKQLGSALMPSEQARKKIAIFGALTLYLDFINLFLFMLRIMGQGKQD